MDAKDRGKFGPPDDTPIMPWYAGLYAHGFVALHPFFTVDGLDPRTCEHGTLILSGSAAPAELGLLQWTEDQAARRRVGKEIASEGVDGAAKRFGLKVSWRAMCQQVGFTDHCELDRALRTSIGGLRRDLAAPTTSDRLVSYCSEHHIFLPTEGRFEPVLQSSLATMFRQAGCESVIVGNGFDDDERLVPTSVLEKRDLWDGRPELPQYGVSRLIAPDRSLFAWVHWDSFYTLILGTTEAFRDGKVSRLFEGFWCSEKTNTYWLNQPPIPLVE